MNKIYILFTFCLLWIASVQLNAQDPSLCFNLSSSVANPAVGEEIDIAVSTGDGFTDITGLQFGLNYNGAALEFLSVDNSSNPLSNYSAVKRPSKSEIVNVWIAFPNPTPITLAPNTPLYTARFRVLSTIGNSVDIICGGDEVGCEFSDSNLQRFEDLSACQTADINGGGAAQNEGPINVSIQNTQASTGDEVCVEFAVSDFVDILSMQFSIQYDPSVLSFSGILQDTTNCPGSGAQVSNPLCLTSGNFNEFAPGTLTFSFSDFGSSQSFTLPDGTVILNLCFDVTGAGGTNSDIVISDNPTFIQITKNGEGSTNFGLVSNVGSVDVLGSGGALDIVSYSIGNASGDNGTNVCVPVTVDDGFDDITGFSWTINYDNTILDFTGLQNVNPALIASLGSNEPNSGSLLFTWAADISPNSQVSLPDGTVLYEMCYDVIGNSGQVSPIRFSNAPILIETVKIDGPDPDSDQDLTIVDTTDGNISVSNSDGFNFIVCEADACPSDQVCVPVLATGAVGIASLQFTLSYDPTVLDFNSFTGNSNVIANEPANNPGNIIVIYISLSNPPEELNLQDCGQFGEFCFDVIGGQGSSTVVEVTDDPTEFRVAIIGDNGVGEDVEASASPGAVNVNCGGAPGSPVITCDCGSDLEEFIVDVDNTIVNDVVCNGDQNGSIILSVSGGQMPFTYDWSNNATTKDISNLGPGNYTVDVTDNTGAVATASFTVEEPQVLQPSSMASNTTSQTANDGMISLNVSGGVAPYSYAWSSGQSTATISGLAPNAYSVTVTDANGCTLVTSRTIGTPVTIGPAGTTVITDVVCFGENTGSIDLMLSGGVAPFSFAWSNNINQEDQFGLAAGTYCVTVVDTNGESIDACFDVAGPTSTLDIATVSELPQSIPGANDGAIDINVAGGGSSYTYIWNGPGINNVTTQDISGLTEGSYTVQVTDDFGCVRTRTFFVPTAGEALSIDSGASLVADVRCFGEDNGAINAVVNGGATPYSYSWSGPGSFAATTQNISGLAPGSYQLTVTDNNGESTVSVLFLVTEPSSPLSATGQITDESSPGANDGGIVLSTTGGTPGYSFAWSNNNFTNSNFGLTMGTYTVTITDTRGCTFIESYVVRFDANPLVINALGSTVVDVRCFGDANGSVTPMVNGGVEPYTYNWDTGASTPTISGLTAGEYTVTVTGQANQTAIQTFLVGTPTAINIVVNGTTAETGNGNDGSISISVSGGTPGYAYSWTGPNSFTSTAEDLTNLAEGVYTITVIDDNGCTGEMDILLGAVLFIENKRETDVDCFGECTGEIDIVVVGGRPPYLYNWAGPNGFSATTQDLSDLCAGVYSATITDNVGQNISTTCRIDEPLLPLNIGANPTIVNEVVPNLGAINITVNGGTPPYTYQWSNQSASEDITDLEAGSYRVTITDGNGCILVSPEYVVEREALPINIEELITEAPTCGGDCNGFISVRVQGGDPAYGIEWNDGFSQILSSINPTFSRQNLCAGVYIVTITDGNGQAITQSITLTDIPPIEISEVITPEVSGMDGAINTTVVGGQAPYDYNWAPSTLPATADQENLTAGLYIVTVTDANDCTSIKSFIVPDNILPLTFDGNVVFNQLDCFGDTDGSINITINGGVLPYSFTWSDSQNQVTEDAIGLAAGSYNVTIVDADGTEIISPLYEITQPDELLVDIANLEFPDAGMANGRASAFPSGGTPPYMYMWESGEISQNAANLVEGVQNVTVTDANGCVVMKSFFDEGVPLSSSPDVLDISCNGDASGMICVQTAGGVSPFEYIWSTGETTECISRLLAGTYSYTCTDARGTVFESEIIELTEPDPLDITFEITAPTTSESLDGGAIAIVTGGTAPYTYQWSNPDNGGCNTANCEPLVEGVYFVVVQDANECILVDSVGVFSNDQSLDECLETRNIITPAEDDGKNDSFLIQCAPGTQNTIEIFNRFGQQVFFMENYDNSWEGTDRRGNLLPAGGYFYVFIIENPNTGESVPYQGHITILRQ